MPGLGARCWPRAILVELGNRTGLGARRFSARARSRAARAHSSPTRFSARSARSRSTSIRLSARSARIRSESASSRIGANAASITPLKSGARRQCARCTRSAPICQRRQDSTGGLAAPPCQPTGSAANWSARADAARRHGASPRVRCSPSADRLLVEIGHEDQFPKAEWLLSLPNRKLGCEIGWSGLRAESCPSN